MNLKKPLVDLYYCILDLLPDELALKVTGWRKLGYWMNLKNPTTFNEKVNWRKLYQRDPRFDLLSDKQDAKSYITEKIGEQYTVPTQWCGADFGAIPWDDLTYPLVIKTTHSTGDVFFVKSKKGLDVNEVYQHFQKFWDNKKLKRYSRSTHESKNKRFIIEEMLGDGSKIPEDYKFYCYHGRVHFIHVISGRFKKLMRRYYNRNWVAQDFGKDLELAPIIPRPEKLDEMLKVAEALANEFDYIRVDLYQVDGRIYCGELTFTPDAGFGRLTPEEGDYLLGEPWKIDDKKGC